MLREDVSIEIKGDLVKLSGPVSLVIENISEFHIEQIKYFRRGVPEKDKEIYKKSKIFHILKSQNLLIRVPEKSCGGNIKWLAHFGSEVPQSEYLNKRILVVGCGGIGSIFSDHLARLGFKDFILLDDDIVSTEDLNRQLPYDSTMVGRKKVEALRKILMEEHQAIDVHVIDDQLGVDFLDRYAFEKPIDFIACCADTPMFKINLWCTKLSLELDCAVIFGASGIDDYVIGPLLVNRNSKNSYIKFYDELSKKKYMNSLSLGSSCIINTMNSVDMAIECFLFLSKIESPKTMGKVLICRPFLGSTEICKRFE